MVKSHMNSSAIHSSIIHSSARTCALATNRLRPLPGFVIVGTQRGGTTSLYKHLLQHPSVAPSLLGIKEMHFFDNQYSKGMAWYRANFPSMVSLGCRSLRTGQRMVTGDASPYYMFHPHAPHRIAQHLPDAKLIVMLRDPVERAYSHYQWEVSLGFETLSFEEALEQEDARLAGEEARMKTDPEYQSTNHQHYAYLSRGLYADQLATLMSLFRSEQLLVLQSEAFYSDPPGQFDRVLRFLELPPFTPSSYRNFNPGSYSKMSASTRSRLVSHFSAPNRRLYEQLGVDFGWGFDAVG